MDYEQLLNKAYDAVKLNLEEINQQRFEIPKIKGHHLGNRTVITNYLHLVTHLRREPEHLIKFLTKELACSIDFQNERIILSRKLSSKEINNKIERYVNQFVICQKCKKPDTEIKEENGKNFIHCLACGSKYQIHKL
ncbi:MAG: translation initiation factor IF-2 subunit beta [Candidatus Pacearchaeota archaeon]